jgi:hypothetical protein
MNITTMSVPSPTRCSESTVKRRFVSSTTYTKVTVENPKIHAHRSHKLGRMTKVHAAGLVVVLAAIYVIMSKFSSSLYTSSHILKHTRPEKNVNLTNEFVSTFAKIIREDRPTFNTENAVPLILKNGKILCSSTHKRQIQQMRVLAFLEMVSRGLELDYYHSTSYANDGLPILLMNGDGMGCNITSHTDSLPFPRLSWSIPSPKHDEESSWCHSVGMVSYETWNAFHKRHDKHHTWDDTFANDEYRHPWESKIPKAIWRGTSTHEQTRTKDWEFEDIPRAVLVKAGMENPDVIDAGFTAIIQKFEKDKEELEKRTRMGDYIPFVDQMKYKGELIRIWFFTECSVYCMLMKRSLFLLCNSAFIDIDGNNWSSRFIRLLCTNSVVIKVRYIFMKKVQWFLYHSHS